jgi:hypothetical protein
MGLGGYKAGKLESYAARVPKRLIAFWPPSLSAFWLPGKLKQQPATG